MPAIRRLAVIAACAAGVALPAWAQTPPPGDSKVSFQSGLIQRKPKAGPPDVPAPPQAWPRLDPGAVLCKTEDDLDRLAARNAGESSGGPVDCRILQNTTAITILNRFGPGKSEVKLTSGQVGTVGWTNTWLPESPPGIKRTAARPQ
ncbi:hypothetical protein [Rhodopila sp.]|jgi:hypothetical protein|uniref:hypothetical protein n=1 Tax=Rhodopila sp. TaxID=2480087 RepID=UPI002BFC1CED|nr:hypothetical protein [Rhodopila sp.]HVZ09142.1 hypothetical protein [Rhodopila sp.]